MKTFVLAGALALAIVSGETMAACSGNGWNLLPGTASGNAASITQDVAGQMVCATSGSDKWQEEHRSGGELWDYKLGPTSTVDPTEKVGNWSIDSTNNQITHSYGAGGSYTYYVWKQGNNYCFSTSNSSAAAGIQATIKAMGSACPP